MLRPAVCSCLLQVLFLLVSLHHPSTVTAVQPGFAVKRSSTGRFVQDTTDGILLDKAVSKYDKDETWQRDYRPLLKISDNELDSLLLKEMGENYLLDEACKEAEAIMQAQKSDFEKRLEHSKLKELSPRQRIAVLAYTLDEPTKLYEEFNKQTRLLKSSSDWQAYPYKSMLVILNKAIKKLGSHATPKTIYRGVGILFGTTVGEAVMLRQISSCSTDRSEALKFTKGKKSPTLFVITTRHALGIKALSQYPYEEEFLIRSHEHMKVTKIFENSDGYREIHLEIRPASPAARDTGIRRPANPSRGA